MKNKAVYLVIFFTMAIIVGCSPSPLNKAKAEYMCQDHHGLYEVKTVFTINLSEFVVCNSGKKYSMEELHDTIISNPDYHPDNY